MNSVQDDRFRVLVEDTILVGLPASGPPGPIGPPGPGGAAGGWRPIDHGLLAWAYDPSTVTAQSGPAPGVMTLVRMRLETATGVTGILAHVVNAGSGLVAGQCRAALFEASTGALVESTPDQSDAWQTPGPKPMPLVGGPLTVPAGEYFAGWWHNGTTAPQWARSNASSTLVNANLTLARLRYATTVDTYTGVPPAALGTLAWGISFWAALY